MILRRPEFPGTSSILHPLWRNFGRENICLELFAELYARAPNAIRKKEVTIAEESVKSNSHYRILWNQPLTHRQQEKISNRTGKWNCLIVAAVTLSTGREGGGRRAAPSLKSKGAFLAEQSAKALNTFGSVKRNILELSRRPWDKRDKRRGKIED
ncbi:hypothetical protein HN011_002730 [Eciton burchellii]|nr:hypothetical protein HN011_002730 [Eciton burchellii]